MEQKSDKGIQLDLRLVENLCTSYEVSTTKSKIG